MEDIINNVHTWTSLMNNERAHAYESVTPVMFVSHFYAPVSSGFKDPDDMEMPSVLPQRA